MPRPRRAAAALLAACAPRAAAAQAADPSDIDVVHVVSLCHLDAGYKYPYVAEVATEWIQRWIPASIALSDEMRAAGGEVQHRWTMNPFVASLLLQCFPAQWSGRGDGETPSFPLHCPNASQVAAFRAAVQRGDINLYASNFCTMYEYGDASLVTFLSDFAHSVADLAGAPRRPWVASQRDEPGVTRAAVPLLAARGVTALSMGVDWASPPAAVPRAFVWRDEASGTELLVAWHNYGYGGGHSGRSGVWPGPYPGTGDPPEQGGPALCQSAPPRGQRCNSTLTVPGLRHALALFVQDDNAGPPTRAQLEHYFAEAHRMFPNARVAASTFEEFFSELEKVRHTLPVVTSEIGDTWVDTPPSDPLLAAQFRALMRARTRCAAERPGVCNASDTGSAFYNFSRLLIKNVEHDWGGKGSFDDRWTNAELRADLSRCAADVSSSAKCASAVSWADQRAWGTSLPVAALRDAAHPLLADAERELAATAARRPDPAALGAAPVAPARWRARRAVCGGMRAGFDAAGALDYVETAGGAAYADASHLLAEPVVHVSSPAQRRAWAGAYMTDPPAAEEFFKTACPLGDGVGHRPTVDAMWADEGAGLYLMRLRLPAHVVSDYGGAGELWLEYRFAAEDGGCGVSVALTALNKTATRVTESWWLRFHPAAGAHLDPGALRLDKLGALISPADVVFNGSKALHGVSAGVAYGGSVGGPQGFSVASIDAPVVKVGAGAASLAAGALLDGLNPAPVPNDRDPDPAAGFAFNLHNNLWNTNGIQWYPYDELGRDMLFRFHIHVPEA